MSCLAIILTTLVICFNVYESHGSIQKRQTQTQLDMNVNTGNLLGVASTLQHLAGGILSDVLKARSRDYHFKLERNTRFNSPHPGPPRRPDFQPPGRFPQEQSGFGPPGPPKSGRLPQESSGFGPPGPPESGRFPQESPGFGPPGPPESGRLPQESPGFGPPGPPESGRLPQESPGFGPPGPPESGRFPQEQPGFGRPGPPQSERFPQNQAGFRPPGPPKSGPLSRPWFSRPGRPGFRPPGFETPPLPSPPPLLFQGGLSNNEPPHPPNHSGPAPKDSNENDRSNIVAYIDENFPVILLDEENEIRR